MQTNWEAIGYTTHAVLGAQIADPHGRSIHVIGDGAFQETAQEIATFMKYGLAPRFRNDNQSRAWRGIPWACVQR
jgi:TPP-dependent 2-oxoacid decarboxylase